VSAYDVVSAALDSALERGFMRHDKYSEIALEPAQRTLLANEIEQSFWLALDDAGVELR